MLQNHSWQSRLRLASFSTHFSVRKYRMKQYVSRLILYCFCKLGWSPFWVFWLLKRPKHPWNTNIFVPFVTSMILCFPRWTFLCVGVAFQYGVTDYCLRIIFELYVFTVIQDAGTICSCRLSFQLANLSCFYPGCTTNHPASLCWFTDKFLQPRNLHNSKRSLPVCTGCVFMQPFVKLFNDTFYLFTAMLWYEGEDCLHVSCV